jgi:hypothetical protein
VDGCTTRRPAAARSPGPARSTAATKAASARSPSRPVASPGRGAGPANQRDDGLLAATLDAISLVGALAQRPTVHLDAGDGYQPCRQLLAERELVGEIAIRGIPAPIQGGRR